MKRLIIQDSVIRLSFYICLGDECGLCDKCKIRFACYTGEVSEVKPRNRRRGRVEEVEVKLFGKINHKLFYDNETHDKYYKVTSHRWDRSFENRGVAQSG